MNRGILGAILLTLAIVVVMMVFIPGAPTPEEMIPSWEDIKSWFVKP